MARFSPYSLQLQLTRLFRDGQSFFAVSKVEQWLLDKGEDPQKYLISFLQQPAPADSEMPYLIEVQLKRRDGQPVDDWILEQLKERA
jgi:hypothetical protein